MAGDAGDLIVVGAGPWGLGCAWACARAGADVIVLDDGAAPAARVAAGMLGPWSEAEPDRPALGSLMARAAAAWPAYAAALADTSGHDVGYRASGTLLVAHRPEHVGEVRHRLGVMARVGQPVPWRTGGELRALEPGLSPRAAGGADLAHEHQVDPRRVMTALRAAATGAGAHVVTDAAVAVRGGAVRCASGATRRGRRVLVAAGAASGRLGAPVAVRPVKGQILRLRAREGDGLPIDRVVRTPAVYLVPRADGELVVGATSEEAGDLRVDAGAVQRLLEEAIHAVPGVRDLEWREAAAGLRPATPDGLPALAEDADGVLWATGGYRHGILLTPAVAEDAAALVAGAREAACASS